MAVQSHYQTISVDNAEYFYSMLIFCFYEWKRIKGFSISALIKPIQHYLVNMMINAEDLLWPWTTIEWSLKYSCRQHHLILGRVVICIHGRRGHAPPAKTGAQSRHVRPTSRSHWHQIHLILPRCAVPCQADCRSVWKALEHWSDMPPPSRSLIRDKDQFGGETLVAWEHLWTAAVFCWVSTTGMCPRRSVQPPLWKAGRWGWGSDSLVSVGSFPQLVRSHSGREVVVLHDVLEVKIWHHLELNRGSDRRIAWFSEAKWDVWAVRTNSTVPHLPTSLNTLSSFVEFIMNSGYPTMLYIASACDKYKKKREKL